MRFFVRKAVDKIFTAVTGSSVLMLVAVLVIVLFPMVRRGVTAIFFTSTVEWRKMQLAVFGRGDEENIHLQSKQTDQARAQVYQVIEEFKQGVDDDALSDKAGDIYQLFGSELRDKDYDGDEYLEIRRLSRAIRDSLETAFESNDGDEINESLDFVLDYEGDERFKGTVAEEFFALAGNYRNAIKNINLEQKDRYAASLAEIEEIIAELFGPRPGQATPALIQERYGTTRWDMTERVLERLIWIDEWVETEPGQPLVKVRKPRKEAFAGTAIEPMFDYVEANIGEMMNPRVTFYWRYFLDDSTQGHYFGGVGPEILGTLCITLLSMLFVAPLGVIAAAYLVECTKDGPIVRLIRMGINTLAGVPSIVFGLFGLAFFVGVLIPMFGGPSDSSMLAASMTLAILTLPVMIRSSEEAIRTVPRTYKEASLGLGAGRFRTFISVTLPAALPGILTGVILSLSRVAGETAPILFTGAVAAGPIPHSVLEPTRTLSYGSYDIAVGDRLAMLVPHQQYGMVVTLVLLVLVLNAIAIVLRSRLFKKLKGH